jgi:putative transposase
MDKYQNKYRIPSARLPHWDYGSNGAYFITICTAQRTHFLGTVTNGILQLNALGTLAQQYWREIPQHFPYVQLANFVAMPNHTHGILMIDKSDAVQAQLIAPPPGDTPGVQTQLIASLPGGFAGQNNPLLNDNIPRVIRWYKGRCAFEIRKINPAFAWQPRYHDHIIRDAASFHRIQHYIANNPLLCEKDTFHGQTV